MTFEEELTVLSTKCKNHIRTGQISLYSCALKEMADLFRRNNCIRDQLRLLVISFYIDLSSFGQASFIDHDLVEQIQTVMQLNSIDIKELEHSFVEWIEPDLIMKHALGLKDSWYLLRLCVEGKVEQADYILTKI